MAWSNNAEDIYSFRINRVDPLYIPVLSYFLGTVRYDFFYGSLKGHTAPNDDWTHSEIISFRPTNNFEFSFQRTIVFGGKGHEPVTLHNFLKGFFDTRDTTTAEKYSRTDPGARFSDFSFSYRLPYLRNFLTLYADSLSHDDVTPISAPRRASYRTGLSPLPTSLAYACVSLRVEGASTEPDVAPSAGGNFTYYETIQRQAYTNQGFILGDWIGREAKGGQAWLTWQLAGDQWLQLQYLNKKTPSNFIPGNFDQSTQTYGPGGTTQNSIRAQALKRLLHGQVELNAWIQYERWRAPIYLTGPQSNTSLAGPQSNTSTAVQVTFFPALRQTTRH